MIAQAGEVKEGAIRFDAALFANTWVVHTLTL